MGQTRTLFVYFRPFLNTNFAQNLTLHGISRDGVHGIRTRDRGMVGTDESPELWWPQYNFNLLNCVAQDQHDDWSHT